MIDPASFAQIAVAVLGGGGGIISLVTLLIKASEKKRTEKNEELERQLRQVQAFYEKNEQLQKKLLRDIRTLDNHIARLEHEILRVNPGADIPPRPLLEFDRAMEEK